MENLTYILIFVGLFVSAIGGVILKRKFQIKEDEIKLMKLVLTTVDFLGRQFEFKYKDDMTKIIEYCFEALNFVNEIEDVKCIRIKAEIVKDKTFEICERNGVDLGDGTIVEIVDKIVEYILEREQNNKK